VFSLPYPLGVKTGRIENAQAVLRAADCSLPPRIENVLTMGLNDASRRKTCGVPKLHHVQPEKTSKIDTSDSWNAEGFATCAFQYTSRDCSRDSWYNTPVLTTA
jgi:hypothetical protein